MQAFNDGGSFKEYLLKDEDVAKYMTAQEIKEKFSLEHHMRQVPVIFDRVFGK